MDTTPVFRPLTSKLWLVDVMEDGARLAKRLRKLSVIAIGACSDQTL